MDYKKTYMWSEINEAKRVVAELGKINAPVIDEIVSAVKVNKVKNMCLAGRGTSDHALMFFKYAAEIITELTAGYVAPSVVTMYDGKVNFGGNLVVGCSQSGHAADVIAVIEKSRAQGAVTVAVTNDEQSPLAKAAQFHLYLNAGKEISVAATKTFTAQLYALILLAAALGGKTGLTERMNGLSERMDKYIAEADKLTDEAAERLKDMKDGFCLARGITYAIAFESALKLQETCYIRMRGYAMSDFYHGPMAMVGKGTKLLVYAPAACCKDEKLAAYHLADQKKCIDKMLELGGDVTLVTDCDELAEYGDRVHLSKFDNCGCEFESMFLFALYAQMLACKISCAIGNDPDNPKALNKVTITK